MEEGQDIAEDSNFTIKDMENYTPEKEQVFSYQQLIMRALNRCVEAGGKEMRSGYWNEKSDGRGNVVRNYVEDTRKSFNESVKTAQMLLECHFDEGAVEKIKELKGKLEQLYKKFCDQEVNDWNMSPINVRKSRWENGIFLQPDCLSEKLPYFQYYMGEEVTVYREVFTELTHLIKRLKFFEQEDLIN